MNWAFELGRIFGIRVRVHWLFVALLGFLLLFGGGLSSVVMIVSVFGFVVLHELGHSLVARYHGLGVRDITLLPIGGVARLEGPMPSPKAELRIAIAGPLVNLVLALLLLPLAVVAGTGGLALRLDVLGSLGMFLAALVSVNVGLALFNLLPAFPMDGGRVLRAYLAGRCGMLEGTRRAAHVGRWVAIFMAVAGVVLVRPMLIFIALFVYFAGRQEEMAVRIRQARAPTLEFDPFQGWRYRNGQGPSDSAPRVDPREVEAILQQLKRQMGR